MVGADKPLVQPQPEIIISPDGRPVVVDHEAIEITANPLDKVKISSWWKAGAGPDQLMADGDDCVLELGEEYKPEANFSIVTIGLQMCMKGQGWFALEVK